MSTGSKWRAKQNTKYLGIPWSRVVATRETEDWRDGTEALGVLTILHSALLRWGWNPATVPNLQWRNQTIKKKKVKKHIWSRNLNVFDMYFNLYWRGPGDSVVECSAHGRDGREFGPLSRSCAVREVALPCHPGGATWSQLPSSRDSFF